LRHANKSSAGGSLPPLFFLGLSVVVVIFCSFLIAIIASKVLCFGFAWLQTATEKETTTASVTSWRRLETSVDTVACGLWIKQRASKRKQERPAATVLPFVASASTTPTVARSSLLTDRSIDVRLVFATRIVGGRGDHRNDW